MMQDFLSPDSIVVKMVLDGIFGITGTDQGLSPWLIAQLLFMLDKVFAEVFKAYAQGVD